MKTNKFCFGLLLALGLSACAPADGPTTGKVLRSARQNDVPIIGLTEQVVGAIGVTRQGSGSLAALGSRPYMPGMIKSGDTISVTVFDTGEAGLFSAQDTAALTLGEFAVTPGGTVSLPFAGTLQVAGRSVSSAQRLMTDKLRESSVNPFATVNITRKETDTYSVQGEVAASGVQNLTARSERVLDSIAGAGGFSGKPDQTVVTVVRDGRQGQQTLSKIIATPSENIALAPGDVVIVGGGDATFIADGALVQTGEFSFAEGDLSLAQAVSKAGGLSNQRSNPKSVFVFRTLRPSDRIYLPAGDGGRTQIIGDMIVRADFKDPSERLRAGRFQMRSGDVLYVGNAPLANISKYFQIFNSPPEFPALPQP